MPSTASMRCMVLGQRGAADLHLHHGVAAVQVALHLAQQALDALAGVVVAAGGIDEHLRVGHAVAVALRQHVVQRLARDLGHGVPDRHVERADRHRALAVAARLFVGHHAGPDLVRVEVVAGLIEQGRGLGLEHARAKAFADQLALAVAAVGVEAVADDRLAVAHHVGDDGDQAERHLREVDVGVADVRLDGPGRFEDVDDFHGVWVQGKRVSGPATSRRRSGGPGR